MTTQAAAAIKEENAFDADSGFIGKITDAITIPFAGGKDSYYSKQILFWVAMVWGIAGLWIGNVLGVKAQEKDPSAPKMLGTKW